MRRADREIGAFAQKLEILRRCAVIHLAMMDDQGLYSLPLSFGCQVEGEGLKKKQSYCKKRMLLQERIDTSCLRNQHCDFTSSFIMY